MKDEQQHPTNEPKKLYRSKTNRMISGVCGGMADYFNVDVTIVRIGWVVGSLISGLVIGVIAYIVAVIIVPESQNS